MEGNYHTAPEINITCPGVLKLLQTLNPNKAAGPDNIPPRVLKAPEIAPILTIIFRKTGEIPPDWRLANVSPVYKKGIGTRLRIIDQYL